MAFPLVVTGWSLVNDCSISWSSTLVSLDEAHILIINLSVILWLFLLLSYVGLWSVIMAFPGLAHLFLSIRP